MTIPKRHHYVPEWYLKRFVDPQEKLFVYDLKKKEVRRQKTSKVMVIKHYNRQDWAPKGTDVNVFEKFLSVIEGKINVAMGKLIKNPLSTTDDDMAVLLMHLEFQRVQVPRQMKITRNIYEAFIQELALKDPKVGDLVRNGMVKIVTDAKKIRFDFLKNFSGTFTPYFARMNWEICKAPKGLSFVTTDSPVSFFHAEFPPPLEPGISLVGTAVLFPLSSSHLLILRHPEIEQDPSIPLRKKVTPRPLQNGRISITYTYDVELEKNRVFNMNEVFVALADRYVVAAKKSVLDKSLVTFKKIDVCY